MPFGDLWGLLRETLRLQKLRSLLTMLGVVIGVASVVILGSIGEGTREGIAVQFAQFGTTIIGVSPGKQKTFGAGPGVVGGTTRPLTIEDALSLRHLAGVEYVSPRTTGMAEVKSDDRSRRTYVNGTAWEDEHILDWHPRIGTFLPRGDPDQAPAVCVMGSRVSRELFPEANPLGSKVRIGEARFTVVGVMASRGQVLGFDLDDMVYIPVRRALKLFNREGLGEIHILVANHGLIDETARRIRRALMERHDGEEDFTLTSQSDMIKVVDDVIGVLTKGVIAIALISLVVGAMGILTISWVSVHERQGEIGLIKALGGSDRQVMLIFLSEAGTLSLAGGAAGIGVALAAGVALRLLLPGLWFEVPTWIVPLALLVSLAVGVVAGLIPALRAARLDPIEALRGE